MACNRLLTKEHRRVQLSVSSRGERHVVKVEMLGFKEMLREKLGMELGALDRQKFRAAANLGDAMVIEDVEESGPAAKAKLKQGYLVSAIEAQEASNTRALMGLMSSVRPGETVRVSVIVPRRLAGNYVEFQRASVDLKAR
jgi:S1-C subfamily serine protease